MPRIHNKQPRDAAQTAVAVAELASRAGAVLPPTRPRRDARRSRPCSADWTPGSTSRTGHVLGPTPLGAWSSGRQSRLRPTAARQDPVDLTPSHRVVVDHVVHAARRGQRGDHRAGRVVDPDERLVPVGLPHLGREPEARGAHLHSRVVARGVVEPAEAQHHAPATRLTRIAPCWPRPSRCRALRSSPSSGLSSSRKRSPPSAYANASDSCTKTLAPAANAASTR